MWLSATKVLPILRTGFPRLIEKCHSSGKEEQLRMLCWERRVEL
jgi:hypothetical protein